MNADQRAAIERALDDPAGGTGGAVEYEPGDDLLHRLHPLTKIVAAIGLVVVAFLSTSLWRPLALVAVLCGLLVAFDLLRSVLPAALLISLPLGAALVVIQGLFYPANTTPLVAVQNLPVIETLVVWSEGVEYGLLFYLRLLTVILSVLLVIKTTHPRKLSIGLAQKGVPHNLTYVFMAALLVAPQMRTRANAIADAQQARGLDTRANLRSRLKALVAMLTPLMVGMLITAQTRSLALEARGFSREGPRTYLLSVSDSRLDRLLRLSVGLCVLVAILVRVIA